MGSNLQSDPFQGDNGTVKQLQECITSARDSRAQSCAAPDSRKRRVPEQETTVAAPGTVLSLRFKDQLGGEVALKVKPRTRLGKSFEAYAAKKCVNITEVAFIFYGCRLFPYDTPAGCDMEDGDAIDAILQQAGD